MKKDPSFCVFAFVLAATVCFAFAAGYTCPRVEHVIVRTIYVPADIKILPIQVTNVTPPQINGPAPKAKSLKDKPLPPCDCDGLHSVLKRAK